MSNIKEPYEISVWEEELIPAYSEYYTGENFTGDVLTEEEFKDSRYRENWVESKENPDNYYYIYGDGTTTIPKGKLPTENNSNYSYKKVIMEHYEETTGIIIGAHDMDSPYAVVNPVLKENVNGSVDLTFTLYYKVFDPDLMDFNENPFISMNLLSNEAKVKLKYRGKWHNLIIKNRVEDSTNYTFTYTCRDLYVNELNKNGFKVELDVELENNQGTITELATTILEDTDWEVVPTEPLTKKAGDTKLYSDAIVETKIEPLYVGTLNQDIEVSKLSNYTPDELVNGAAQIEKTIITKGKRVLFFYSDVVNEKKKPQILCRFDKDGNYLPVFDDNTGKLTEHYKTDVNEDIITNACNYEIVSPEVYYIESETEQKITNIVEEGFDIVDLFRGEKVIKPQKSGYDPDLDQFIFKYRKLDADGNPTPIEYYGYTKTEVLKSDLAQNLLANSDDFTTLQSGWYFDGVPAQTTKTKGVEKTAAYSGQLFNLAEDNIETRIDSATPESVLVLQLKNKYDEEDYYKDIQGELYKITSTSLNENKEEVETTKWLKVGSEDAKVYEDNVRHSFYDRRSSGIEGYIDKTDSEIDNLVSEFLKDNRYSTRSRYAINNGVAANRQVIEQLTPGEEYLFAVSLGKFEEGEEPPEYRAETIKYGTTPPKVYYEFSESKEHNDFIIKAAKLACDIVDESLANDPFSYYMKNSDYANAYNAKYKTLCNEAEKEYEETYIWGLNSVSSDAKDKLRRGGSGYREIFLEYLRGNKTFSYADSKNVKICEYIADKLITYANNSSSTPAKDLYEIFISGRVLNGNENFERYDYHGIYPTMVKAGVDEAIKEQKKLFTLNSKWEPMEYSSSYFPHYDNHKGDIITTDASFCEKLFSAFYRELKDVFIVDNNGLQWINELKITKEDPSFAELVDDIETILKIVYKNAYENGKFLKVYNQAKDYKMPGSGYPEGGAIYRAYKQEWEANAHETAKNEALNQIGSLFTKPEELIKLAPTTTEEENSSLSITVEEACEELKKFVQNFLEQKNDFDSVNKNIKAEDYEKEMLKWIHNYLNDENKNSYYYYLLFFPYFIQYWLEEQEIGTYTLADDRYELNGIGVDKIETTIPRVDKVNVSMNNGTPTQKVDVSYLEKTYLTSSSNATHAAIRTGYNPYLNTGEDLAGGYVFDRNEEVIRLFNPEKDLLGALYKPVLDEKGEYIYDIFEQKYRPFRDWSIKEKRHPITGEKDDDLGLYGDVEYHKTKLFDGRLGKWQEEPVRYRMVRVRENPTSDDYKFLTSEYIAPIFEEDPESDSNEISLIKKQGWFMRYPKGYQCDIFEIADKGKYVQITERKRRKTIFSLLGNNNFSVVNSQGANEETNGITNREKSFFGFSSFLKWLFRGKDSDETGEHSDGIQDIINNSESATLISNVKSPNENYYDEDRTSILVLDIGEGKTIELPVYDNIENKAEIYAAEKNGVIWYNVQNEGVGTPDIPDTVTVTYYTKYKPFYWRHWGRDRFNLKPKICILHNENGVKTFKPFNCVQDTISDDYKVLPIDDYKQEMQAAFFLKDQENSFRFMGDADYGALKYRMDLQVDETLFGDERLLKDKDFWVESPNGENYLRKYKRGDGEVQLWDGHFGKVVECFKEVEAEADDRIMIKETPENNSDKKDGWYNSEDYPGLVEYYDAAGEKKHISLPDYYIYYNDIMIPYDARVLGAKKRFTRQRVPYNADKKLYVYQDDQYIPLDKYYDKNGFTGQLNYDDLKISFIKDFKYNALNFSIEELPDDKERFLCFDLSATRNDKGEITQQKEPDGIMDLTVLKTDEKTIKERWVYWKSSVKEGISLTADPLQSFGILFEYTGPNTEADTKKFPFLGMQLFKNIPYETSSTEVITREYNLDNKEDRDELCNRLSINLALDENLSTKNKNDTLLQTIYNNLYGFDEEKSIGSEKVYSRFYIDSTDSVYSIVKDNPLRQETIKKSLSERDIGLIDKGEYFAFEDISEQTIIVPLFPGEVPDAKKLIRTKYYLYNPDTVTDADSVVYEYVGIEPPETLENGTKYAIDYDPQCQKVRSIRGKESNYFKLLQDCCDTFDCWIDPIVEYDELSGKIKYIEKPVYIQTNVESEDEPQTYIGEATKIKKVDNRIDRLKTKYGNKISEVKTGDIVTGYIWNSTIDFEKELENEEDLKELNRLILFNNNYEIQYIKVPDKKVRFKRYVGKENFNGFKYGVNLKHIKRTIDSNQISTRVIVKANKNENGKDNFCTIQRAYDNPIKENFILDFSYYTQLGLLDAAALNADLYTSINSKLNYYGKLARLNKDIDAIAEEFSGLQIDYVNASASYKTAVLGRDAAAEEISKLALNLTSNYDNYGQIIDSPWTFNKAQEYTYKRQTSAPAITYNMTIDLPYEENPINVKINAPATATQIEYPKYNEALGSLLDQMDELQRKHDRFASDVEKFGNQKKELEEKLLALTEQQRVIVEKKNQLNKLFYHKYSRFIQEGSWIDENYMDDNLYYLDGLSVARTSSRPKITYDIGVVDLSAAVEYEEDRQVLENEIGDRTYIEDTEFFGYRKDKITPYWEEVVVSEKIYYLDDPAQNQVKVKNYTTQFDDLFQRIAATSQTLQFNEGSFNRAAALVQEDGSLNAEALQKTIASGDFIVSTSTNEQVQTDNTGITISNLRNSNIVKIISQGIVVSSDGTHYTTVIDGTGINADLINSGAINTANLLIGNKHNPNFFWDKLGISAFKTEDNGIDYSSFVRLDQFGIYGIKNYGQLKDKTKLSYNNSFEPKSIKEIMNEPGSVFGLTWDGFFLNASNGTGRVTIGTEQDFKMSEFSVAENKWKDRVIIGRLDDGAEGQYYGFRLKNEDNEIVMDTNDRGELYLKNKLRISNFSDMETYSPYEYIEEEDEEGNITTYYCEYTTDENSRNIKIYYTINQQSGRFEEVKREETNIFWQDRISKPQDRVTLGIVDTYKRISNLEDFYTFEKVNVQSAYSSSQYLTKVFSVKENENSPFGQFSQTEVASLIEPNENFAIFDNGNLYAKNAWIEGHIRANSGNILGTLEVGNGEDGVGIIRHANNLWAIHGDGTAYFNNVNISGKISTTIFEHNKTQAIAGTMVIFSAILVENTQKTQDNHTTIFLQSNSLPEILFSETEVYVCFSSYEEISKKVQDDYDKVVAFGKDKQTQMAWVEIEDNKEIDKDTPMFIFTLNKDTTENRDSLFSIAINATDSTVFPKRSISIIDLLDSNKTPKLVLGILGQELFNSSQAQEKFANTYGLYSDNVYLKGTIISEKKNYIAGITTNNLISTSDNDPIVFFAGEAGNTYSKANLSFYVTQSGKIHATNGYFSGVIEASEIRGKENEPGLIFRDVKNAIQFIKTGYNEKGEPDTSKDQIIFDLSTEKFGFYREDSHLTMFEILMGETELNSSIRMFEKIVESEQGIKERTHLLQIEEAENDEIHFKYQNQTQLRFTKDGAKLNNNSGTSIDDFSYFETAYGANNTHIGFNIVIRE